MNARSTDVNAQYDTSTRITLGTPPIAPEAHFKRPRDWWPVLLRRGGHGYDLALLSELRPGTNRALNATTLAEVGDLSTDEIAYLRWIARAGLKVDGSEASLPDGYTALTAKDVTKLIARVDTGA